MATQAEAARQMQAVNAAWAVLGDREARASYDAELGFDSPTEDHDAEPAPRSVQRGPVRTFLRRFAPFLILVAVLGVVLLVTAHAGPAPSAVDPNSVSQ